ncbi:MAG: hypothetical protein PHV59_11605, partial [Victivallales bacterium]|nr:hypothetical protein [Victivallales bacterium]
VTAADYQWKCRAFPAAALDYDPAYQAVRLFVPQKALEPRPGTEMTPIPLEKAVNTALGRDKNFPLLDKVMIENLRQELADRTEKFRLISSGDNYYAAVISGGDDNYPASEITIPLGYKVNSLSLLLAAAGPNDTPYEQDLFNPVVGRITLIRSDGGKSIVDLRYRDSINFWNATAGGLSCRFVSRFNDKRNALCGLFALDWDNPKPDIAIKGIRFAGTRKNGIAPALFALSASGGNVPSVIPAGALPAVVSRNSTKKAESSAHETILAGFDSGMGLAKLISAGKFSSKVKCEIVTDETAPVPGKVLRIDVPPTADYYNRNRVLVDIPFDRSKIKGKINSIILDYKIEEPEFIYLATTYLIDKIKGGCLGFFSFTRYHNDNKWHHLALPLKMMRGEGGGTTGERGNQIRVSFFLRSHDRPFSISLARIGVSDEVASMAPPFRIEKLPQLEIGNSR